MVLGLLEWSGKVKNSPIVTSHPNLQYVLKWKSGYSHKIEAWSSEGKVESSFIIIDISISNVTSNSITYYEIHLWKSQWGELPKTALQKVYKMLSFELISQKT